VQASSVSISIAAPIEIPSCSTHANDSSTGGDDADDEVEEEVEEEQDEHRASASLRRCTLDNSASQRPGRFGWVTGR